ncbi:MAG: Gfo/Idh/MocA family oxidoreductase [Maricaulaceae bacterium]|nr:Gfo/Idh/MocA family oxidoreductase [Maricaulaceae bacterium]
MTSLKAGVIGAGVFGGYHAGKYAASPRAQFIGVFDPNPEKAAALTARFGGEAFASAEALIEACEAVTIATPAVAHFEPAMAALAAGRHVLIEKPISETAEQGRAMVALAAERGLVLQVGHQERFVFRAMGLFDTGAAPRHVLARRMGPPSDRNLDVSVTLDLMIHDLDLALALARAPLAAVEGRARPGRFGSPDEAFARLTFRDGYEAELVSSRVAPARDRVMRVDYDQGFVEVDFVARTFRNETPFALDPDFADSPMARDALGANVEAFLNSVLDGAAVAVSGEAGLAALEAALQIDASASAA